MASDIDGAIASGRRFNALKQKRDCEQQLRWNGGMNFSHRLKLCTFGGILRPTGSGNMASAVVEQNTCARRLVFL